MAGVRFPVEAGHILMFARALGDPNPIYGDEEYARTAEPGGIIAPPTFGWASAQFDPDFVLRPRTGAPWFGSGREPSGAPASAFAGRTGEGGGEGFHAEQHFEYLRPLRPGDVLTVTTGRGRSWEKQGRRGGRLRFSELVTEYRDAQGELVLVARGVGVQTERAVEGG